MGNINKSDQDVIQILTVSDTEIEVHETIEITAVVKHDDREISCSTTVYILDGSKWLMYNFSILTMIITILPLMYMLVVIYTGI